MLKMMRALIWLTGSSMMIFAIALASQGDFKGALMFAIIATVILLPPKYDPAIRIKEWQIKQGWHPEAKDTPNAN